MAQNNFSQEIFAEMVQSAVSAWKEAEFFILPIMRRRDVSEETVNSSNHIINAVCSTYKVVALKPFVPETNMYYDNVHLNDKVGLPTLIRHIKIGMNLGTYYYRLRLSRNSTDDRPNSSTVNTNTPSTQHNTLLQQPNTTPVFSQHNPIRNTLVQEPNTTSVFSQDNQVLNRPG